MYFKSINSDTEVLLNALVCWGIEKTLRKLNGMFAFAFYSKSLSKVFIARDRIGIKQLYFCLFNGFFCFSSEIKAIKKANLFSLELNLERLSEYLRFRYITAPNTMFKNIFKPIFFKFRPSQTICVNPVKHTRLKLIQKGIENISKIGLGVDF